MSICVSSSPVARFVPRMQSSIAPLQDTTLALKPQTSRGRADEFLAPFPLGYHWRGGSRRERRLQRDRQTHPQFADHAGQAALTPSADSPRVTGQRARATPASIMVAKSAAENQLSIEGSRTQLGGSRFSTASNSCA